MILSILFLSLISSADVYLMDCGGVFCTQDLPAPPKEAIKVMPLPNDKRIGFLNLSDLEMKNGFVVKNMTKYKNRKSAEKAKLDQIKAQCASEQGLLKDICEQVSK